MIPLVWSEREPGGWHDCWASAYLMGLVATGVMDYPLGLYSSAEREAFERSQTMFPPETGGNNAAADEAAMTRYGRKLDAIGLTTTLLKSSTGMCYVVAGRMGNFAVGSSIRRWDPSFDGQHMLAVVPNGDGSVLWLDPLAPNRYAGDTVSYAIVDQFRRGMADQTRVAPIEAAEEPMLKYKAEGWTVAKSGGPIYDSMGGAQVGSLPAGTPVTTIGESLDGNWRPVLVSDTGGTNPRWVYIQRAAIVPMVQGGDVAFNAAVYELLTSRKAPVTETVTITSQGGIQIKGPVPEVS